MNKKITLDVKNEEIGAVVGKMFAGQNVVSSVEGKMIAIMSAPAKRDAAARASVNAVVKGVVKDSAGNPITGATVIVDGTTIGATTDLDGSFSVRIGARTDVRLIVSYLGLKTGRLRWTIRHGSMRSGSKTTTWPSTRWSWSVTARSAAAW